MGLICVFLEEVIVTFIEPCTADAEKIRFKAKFSRDISEALPYVNAQMKRAQYNNKIESLTYTKGIKMITIYSETLAVAKVINETEVYEVCDNIKDLINEAYEKRDSIEPLFETRKKPSALIIYKYLPKTNCKKCGEVTCIAFATKLILGEFPIEQCPCLQDVENKENLDKIMEIV